MERVNGKSQSEEGRGETAKVAAACVRRVGKLCLLDPKGKPEIRETDIAGRYSRLSTRKEESRSTLMMPRDDDHQLQQNGNHGTRAKRKDRKRERKKEAGSRLLFWNRMQNKNTISG